MLALARPPPLVWPSPWVPTHRRAYYVAYITVETVDNEVRTRNPHINEAQTPYGALSEYIKTREDLIELEDELLKYGIKLIDELMQKKAEE